MADRARRAGPLRFDQVMEVALYDARHGFYETSEGAGGHGGDFLTSPEIGPLFGTVLAGAVDTWWDELARPDPFVVVEAGAGRGALAAAVLAAPLRCRAALRYVVVERSAALRRRQAELLRLEPATELRGPVVADDADLGPRPLPGTGPRVSSLPALPAGPFDGVVLANELLDNLPFRLLQRSGSGHWDEVLVSSELEEVLVPAPDDVVAEAAALAPSARAGGRVPVQRPARSWLAAALRCLSRGRVVVIDYADTTEAMASRPWTTWLRTYRGHGRGGHPLDDLGRQDVTADVAVDQLALVGAPASNRSQADFLAAHGIAGLRHEARRRWQERAHVGDLESVRWASRVHEHDALVDPGGLGAFRVLEWGVGL